MQTISFHNPICQGADPWMFPFEGKFCLCCTASRSIVLWRAADPTKIHDEESIVAFEPEEGHEWSHDLWSPEIHYFSAADVGEANAGWYMFIAYDDGTTANQRQHVVKCLDGDNLLGRWGHPITGEVNVPQLVTFPDSDYNENELCGGCSVIRIGGKPYITFVSEVGRGASGFHQVICIAEFENPWTIVGTPTVICQPTYAWEKRGYGFAGEDENGNQKEYVFSDEISQSLSLQHKGEFVRMTLNWRSTMNGFYYADNHREHAIYSQVFRWHEMNDKWSAHGNGYMASPLGLRRINIAKYGNYIIIMNCSDEDKAVNVELEADVSKIHDLVTDTMMDVNNSITMPALSTIVLDLRETN